MQDDHHRPQSGDIVIWDMEPESFASIFWVRVHGRGGETHVFEGSDAWDKAHVAATGLAGRGGLVWKRHKDGRFEKILPQSPVG